MAFTGNEDHTITLLEAVELTKIFRDQASSGAVLGGFFGETCLQNILNQEGCVGIRCYYGLSNEGTPHFVLVGVDSEGIDLVDGILAERESPCPPYCDNTSPLVVD